MNIVKKYLALLTIILLLTASVVAHGLGEEFNSLKKGLEGQQIPSPLNKLIGNERANIIVDGGSALGFVTEDGKITSVVRGSVEKPTVNIYVTDTFLDDMSKSTTPVAFLKKGLKSKEIKIKGVGFFNRIKFGFTSFIVKLVSSFSDENDVKNVVTSKIKEKSEEVKQNTKEEIKEKVQEVKENVKAKVIEKVVEKVGEIKTKESPIVKFVNKGFSPTTLTVKIGDTIEFKNTRDKLKAMPIGNSICNKLRGGNINPGDTYSFTFTKPGKCIVIDGFMTTQAIAITVN